MFDIEMAEPADFFEPCMTCGSFDYCGCNGREQECRICDGHLSIGEHGPDWRPKKKQKYYFTKWLQCDDCGAFFMLESYKVKVRRRR